jgi:hypothetical protein
VSLVRPFASLCRHVRTVCSVFATHLERISRVEFQTAREVAAWMLLVMVGEISGLGNCDRIDDPRSARRGGGDAMRSKIGSAHPPDGEQETDTIISLCFAMGENKLHPPEPIYFTARLEILDFPGKAKNTSTSHAEFPHLPSPLNEYNPPSKSRMYLRSPSELHQSPRMLSFNKAHTELLIGSLQIVLQI